MARIDELIHSVPGSEEDAELDRLSDLFVEYEDEHYPMGDPDPHSMLEFMLDQQMVSREQLIPLAGGDAVLDPILEGRAALTSALARLLHERFGTPVEDLLKTSADTAVTVSSD